MRTVVAFERLGTDTILKLEDAPLDIPGIGENAPADVTPPPAGGLMDLGGVLLARLQAHPAVDSGLAWALLRPPGADATPLYFHVLADAADALPWEVVFRAGSGFLALDGRWPVGRIAGRRRQVADRAFAPPLRVLAVLSAAGRSAVPQCRALLDATAGADAAAVGVHLHVVTGEEAVLEVVAQAGRADVTAEVLAGTADGVAEQIRRAQPHVAHLLGHGGEVAGVRTLAFATIGDFDEGAVPGSVRLKLADLVGALQGSAPWLVVLAACESGDATQGRALAHELAGSGLPAVIAMRRIVDLAAMDALARSLYPEVFRQVRAVVDPAGPPGARTLEWAPALTPARQALAGPDPAAADAWTDPVLYVQEDPLRVFPGSAANSPADFTTIRGQLDVWEGLLAVLDPTTADPTLLGELHQRIAQLRAALGPDA